MVHHALAAAAVLALAACADRSSAPSGAVMAGPEVQAAVAACEQKYASHALTSWAQVATCERDQALPEQQRNQPWLEGLFNGVWKDKIDLYGRVDRGELTKEEADRKIAIEADNWLNNILSVRRV